MKGVKKIWLDGKLIDWNKANTHLLTHSLHYGSGVFEGIRVYNTTNGPAVFRLKEHIDRLFYSASVMALKIPFSKNKIREAIINTVKVNSLTEGYIRPLVFFGYGKMGLNPIGAPTNVTIAVWPWGAYLGKEIIKVKISKYIRPHPQSTVTDAKICGSYSNSILASLDATKNGFDEALLLDYQGYVAEGPGENIFMVKNNKLCTPALGTILGGITRNSIIQMAKDQNIEIKEKKITVKELKSADEAFFSGTAIEICAIEKIDKTIINKGKVGAITKKLKEVYTQAIYGEIKKYSKWLTPIFPNK
ncbi:MAG: branched-chain amino acid transaminase [bacterium]